MYIIQFIQIYLLIGIIFYIPFAIYGISHIDSDAKGSPWTFRLIILPGATLLWPMLLIKWIRKNQ